MTDYSELKRLAEATKLESINSVQRDRLIVHFQRAASPAAVLALIAEVEALRYQADSRRKLHSRECVAMHEVQGDLINEREQLKAEVEALRKDAERYRWICDGHGYFLEEQGICGHVNEKECADKEIDYYMENGEPR